MEDFPIPPSWWSPGRLQDPKSQLLARVLVDYDLAAASQLIGGLTTLPQFQANAFRLELLIQLVVGACAGKKKPTHQHLNTWLNRQLGGSQAVLAEDPAEDVFVSNVLTPIGDFRVLPSTWEQGAFATTFLIEAVSSAPTEIASNWLKPTYALLTISDEVVGRSGLQRWHMEPSTPRGAMKILPSLDLRALARRTRFTPDELSALGIDIEALEPFVFNLEERAQLLAEDAEETELHRRPLMRMGNDLIVVMPGAITYAARRQLLDAAAAANSLRNLNAAIMVRARSEVQQIATHGSRHAVERVNLPRHLQGVRDVCASVAVVAGEGRFIHYLLIADDLEVSARSGLLFPHELSRENERRVAEHIEDIRSIFESNATVRTGHTVIVSGFLGQLRVFTPPPERKNWTSVVLGLADLKMYLRDSGHPLDKLILLLNQEHELAEQGLELPNHNGFLNLYQFWSQQGYHLRHSRMGHAASGMIQLETDFVATYRRNRRIAVDEHCVELPNGRSTVVQRSNAEAAYASMRSVPSYVSLDLLRQDVLGFLLEENGCALWVIMAPPSDASARDPAFELWHALELLVYRAARMLTLFSAFANRVTEVVLDFSELVGQRAATEGSLSETSLHLIMDSSRPTAIVRADRGFLCNFDAVENRGEQYLLAEVLRGLSKLSSGVPLSPEEAMGAALNVLGGTGARVLHTFRVWTEVEILLAGNPDSTYRSPIEHIEASLRTVFAWGESHEKARRLDRDATLEAFRQGVDRQVQKLQQRLKAFNRSALLSKLLSMNETLIADRQRWRLTARAIRGLYGVREGTVAAQEAERKRAQLQVSLRALIEAATCECTDDVIEEPDGYQLDELVGAMAAVIELGRDSDVVYFGLASRGMTIHPNGAYELDPDLLLQFAGAFMEESFDLEFKASAEGYEGWIQREAPLHDTSPDEVFDSSPFQAAWLAEYGLPFDAFREILGAFQDLGVARGSVIVSATAAELAANRKDVGVTEDHVRAFLKSFGLPRRTSWPAQPPYQAKDVKPWRFERRLSVSLRPFLLEDEHGDKFTYGVGTARESLMYILDSIAQRPSIRTSFDHARCGLGSGAPLTCSDMALLRKLPSSCGSWV